MTPSLALAQAPLTTTTALSVSPSGSAASGTLLTLTATVTDQNAAAVLYGSVTFYDGTTQLQTVQLVSTNTAGFTPGTATYKTLSLAVGSHSLTAKFTPTNADAASTSTAQTYNITGPVRTVTTLIGFNTGTLGSYNVSATVLDAGTQSPTGTLTVLDQTTGSQLGTAPIGFCSSAGPKLFQPSFSVSQSFSVSLCRSYGRYEWRRFQRSPSFCSELVRYSLDC